MQSVDKKYFAFNKGINTEAPLVGWPEGFTIDEQNFDLLQDGSRRRRKGIARENGSIQEFFTATGTDGNLTSGTSVYRWRNVDNTDAIALICMQVGSTIHFWIDPKAGPLGVPTYEFDLLPYRARYDDPVSGFLYAATDENIRDSTVAMTEIDGKLIVTGKHIEPIQIDLEEGQLTGKAIECIERDLTGLEDGVAYDVSPTVLTEEHKYNLYSRGWSQENIDLYFNSKNVYPSKNMLHFKGMRRQTEHLFTDEDGIKVFSPDKLEAELFQNMSAPQGHITRNVFNRRVGTGSSGQGTVVKTITSVDSVDVANGYITLTSADAAHGLVVGNDVAISGLVVKMRNFRVDRKITIEGEYEVIQTLDSNTFVISVGTDVFSNYPIYVKTVSTGQYTIGGTINVTYAGSEPAETRFTQCASFAGRIFYGGCPDVRLSERIYFSRTVEQDSDLGKVHQEADPTSEFISDLIPTDGGFILIPNLGVLKKLVAFGRSLLVFSSEGVWAIGPGEGGIFSAVGYSVNKLTDMGCLSGDSIVVADNTPMYWSEGGIYAVMQDENSGFLSSQNITQNVINGLYNSIRYTEKTRAKAAYDPIRKRIFWLYNSRLTNPVDGDAPRSAAFNYGSTTVTPLGILDDRDVSRITYDTALIFDLRLGAWTKWVFSCDGVRPIRDIACMPATYSTDTTNSALRFFCQDEGTQRMYIGELTDITHKDWGTETDAFIYTGPDSLGEPERFKYAPYVHVFMRREIPEAVVVEQNFVGGTGVSPQTLINLVVAVRTPSIYMQPRWDWARELDSGKIPNYVQVYRDVRPNPNSFGLIVTKNKVRGRGRNLFLAFKAGATSPAWLDGWTIKYDAQVRI